MPGVKSIVWNDGNDARLLRALCFVMDLSPDGPTAQAIANSMGGTVTYTAVKHRIATAKKLAKSQGAVSLKTSPKATVKRSSTTPPIGTKPASKKRKIKVESDLEDEPLDDFGLAPQGLGSTEAVPWASPRALKKMDYAKIDDPYAEEISDEAPAVKFEASTTDDEYNLPHESEKVG